jgi:hypothetical protein
MDVIPMSIASIYRGNWSILRNVFSLNTFELAKPVHCLHNEMQFEVYSHNRIHFYIVLITPRTGKR